MLWPNDAPPFLRLLAHEDGGWLKWQWQTVEGWFENELHVDLRPVHDERGTIVGIAADKKGREQGSVLRKDKESWSEVLGRLYGEVKAGNEQAKRQSR